MMLTNKRRENQGLKLKMPLKALINCSLGTYYYDFFVILWLD